MIVRLISLFIGFMKYHALSFIHTYANKGTGVALFLFPFAYSVLGLKFTAVLICSMASLSAIEEFIITEQQCIWKRTKENGREMGVRYSFKLRGRRI